MSDTVQSGYLSVLRIATKAEVIDSGKNPKRTFVWCNCSLCGNDCLIRKDHVNKGNASCGCYRQQWAASNGRRIMKSKTKSEKREMLGFENDTNVRRISNIMDGKLCKRNSSGHTGVWKKGNRWIAEIWIKGKKTYLGCFETIEEAVDARKKAEAIYFKPLCN